MAQQPEDKEKADLMKQVNEVIASIREQMTVDYLKQKAQERREAEKRQKALENETLAQKLNRHTDRLIRRQRSRAPA